MGKGTDHIGAPAAEGSADHGVEAAASPAAAAAAAAAVTTTAAAAAPPAAAAAAGGTGAAAAAYAAATCRITVDADSAAELLMLRHEAYARDACHWATARVLGCSEDLQQLLDRYSRVKLQLKHAVAERRGSCREVSVDPRGKVTRKRNAVPVASRSIKSSECDQLHGLGAGSTPVAAAVPATASMPQDMDGPAAVSGIQQEGAHRHAAALPFTAAAEASEAAGAAGAPAAGGDVAPGDDASSALGATLLATMPAPVRRLLLQGVRYQQLAPGTVQHLQGSPVEDIVVVLSGQLLQVHSWPKAARQQQQQQQQQQQHQHGVQHHSQQHSHQQQQGQQGQHVPAEHRYHAESAASAVSDDECAAASARSSQAGLTEEMLARTSHSSLVQGSSRGQQLSRLASLNRTSSGCLEADHPHESCDGVGEDDMQGHGPSQAGTSSISAAGQHSTASGQLAHNLNSTWEAGSAVDAWRLKRGSAAVLSYSLPSVSQGSMALGASKGARELHFSNTDGGLGSSESHASHAAGVLGAELSSMLPAGIFASRAGSVCASVLGPDMMHSVGDSAAHGSTTPQVC